MRKDADRWGIGFCMGEIVNTLIAFNYMLWDYYFLQPHTRLRWDHCGPAFIWVTTKHGPNGKTRGQTRRAQGSPFFSSFFMSLSFSTLWGSLSHSCMRTKGSRPFRLSLCQGLGRDSRSDTEPCVRPRMLSPNSRCPGDRGRGPPVTLAWAEVFSGETRTGGDRGENPRRLH